ncbi:MAG: ComEA family DNA-binding protein [Oscillospiraceae bacterium]|nr:ComEA family DNA-binding protein [Oscillospiraceae bacterium]
MIQYREEHGGFSGIREIVNVSGIGEKTFEQIRDKITVGDVPVNETPGTSSEPPEAALININTATAEELQTISGIGEVKAAAIIQYREEHGGFSDIREIVNVKGIGEKTFEKIRGQIEV